MLIEPLILLIIAGICTFLVAALLTVAIFKVLLMPFKWLWKRKKQAEEYVESVEHEKISYEHAMLAEKAPEPVTVTRNSLPPGKYMHTMLVSEEQNTEVPKYVHNSVDSNFI